MSQPSPRRLYRSRTDRMLSGVSGGLADYFDIDPVLVRLLWVLAAIVTGGMAFIAYLALWIIVPAEGHVGSSTDAARDNVGEIRREAERLAGQIRQSVSGEPISAEQAGPQPADPEFGGAATRGSRGQGEPELARNRGSAPDDTGIYRRRQRNWAGIVLILLGLLFLASNLGLFWWFNWRTAWPVVLILIGVLLLWNRARE